MIWPMGVRWLSGKGIGLVIRRLHVRFLAVKNYVVSLGKAFYPTFLGGMSLYLLYVALNKSVCYMTKCMVFVINGDKVIKKDLNPQIVHVNHGVSFYWWMRWWWMREMQPPRLRHLNLQPPRLRHLNLWHPDPRHAPQRYLNLFQPHLHPHVF